MTDPTIRSNIKPGLRVKIEEKGSIRIGKLVEESVKEILTLGEVHPHGIMVSLESGMVGRVRNN